MKCLCFLSFCCLRGLTETWRYKKTQLVDTLFKLTGQVVTCWEKTQNIGGILLVQPPIPTLFCLQWCILQFLWSLFPATSHLLSTFPAPSALPLIPILTLLLPHCFSNFSSRMYRGPPRLYLYPTGLIWRGALAVG